MHATTTTRKPPVTLLGEDGNAFAIIGACRRAAARAGWTDEQWERVRAQMTRGDYFHLLGVVQEHFDVG